MARFPLKNSILITSFCAFSAIIFSFFKRILSMTTAAFSLRRFILSVATLGASISDELYSLLIDEKLTLHFISAPNIFTGGPLTILISCLESIPSELRQESSRVVVICGTHAYRNISLPPGAYPLCLPLSRTSWLIRLYYERIGFFVLTSLCNVHTWLSLHDFTSNVKAKILSQSCTFLDAAILPSYTCSRLVTLEVFLFSSCGLGP